MRSTTIPLGLALFFVTTTPPVVADPATVVDRLRATVGYLSSEELQGRAAGSPGHEKTRNHVVNRLKALGLQTEVQEAPSPVGLTKGKIHNILATLPAEKHPGARCVVLAAHYDHNPPMDGRYSPGANDNASGVAVLLEIAARAVADFHRGEDYDLHFLFPDQEENFIVGSRHAVKKLRKTCRKILFSVTLDVVGAPFFPGFENQLLALGAESSSDLDAMIRTVSAGAKTAEFQVRTGPIFLIEPAGIARSDYKAFRNRQIPFVFLSAGIPAEYHTPMDTIDRIDFAFLGRVTDYVEAILTRGLRKYWPSNFFFEQKPKFDAETTARGLADLLELMVAHPNENGMTPSEVESFKDRIAKLRSPQGSDATKLGLQLDVIQILKIIARRSPIPNAYLKSVVGKVLN